MSNNTQLPAEVVQTIKEQSEKAYDTIGDIVENMNGDYHLPMYRKETGPIEEVITEYATRLHACDKSNSALEEKNRGLEEQNKELQAQLENADAKHLDAIDLLREVFQKHESGLLPDRFVYEKIKTFLYGE